MFNQEIIHIKNSSKKRLSETCYRDIALIDPNLIHDSVNTYGSAPTRYRKYLPVV